MNSNGQLARLKFTKERDTEIGPTMSQAIQLMDSGGHTVHWVYSDEIETGSIDKNAIYVVEEFNTLLFDMLHRRTRLIGPMVVVAHLTNNWPLPVSHQPVFTLSMYGVYLCCTQIGAKEKRAHIMELAKLMGGKTTGNFTRNVTHLVAGQVGSTKYKVARSLETPVLQVSWVEDCWRKGSTVLLHAVDPHILSVHKCPPLAGCVITSTGFSVEERASLQQLVDKNGGQYSKQLAKDSCTHLLVGNISSQKYHYALQWKVPCVNVQWLYKSIDTGYCQDEEEYSVTDSKKDTTSDGTVTSSGIATTGSGIAATGSGIATTGSGIATTGSGIATTGSGIATTGSGIAATGSGIATTGSGIAATGSCTATTGSGIATTGSGIAATGSGIATTGTVPSIDARLTISADQEQLNNRKRPSAKDATGVLIKKQRPFEEDDNELDELTLLTQYQNAELPELPPPINTGLFSGKTFSINNVISSENSITMATEIKKKGGIILSHDQSCDYHITSLSHLPHLPPTANHVVTVIWLEHCLANGKLLDPSSRFLFRPLPVPIDGRVLEGCVLTISQFDGLDREHLVCLSKSLGAIVQECFARYPSGTLLASTHLILNKPEGHKYNSAISWGVPAVSDKWLFECASTQKIAPVENYLITNTISERTDVSIREDSDEDEVSTFETPLKFFKPNFDVSSILRDVPVRNITTNDSQLANIFNKNMERAIETVSKAETESEQRRQILKDVIVFIHKKLGSRQSELQRLIKSMGGTWRVTYSSDCTHIIYHGKPADISRDKTLSMARQNGQVIVSYHWLTSCSNNGWKEDEILYPCNYNPNKSLSILSQKTEKDREEVVHLDSKKLEEKEFDQIEENMEENMEEEMEEEIKDDLNNNNDQSNKNDEITAANDLFKRQVQEIIKNTGLNDVNKEPWRAFRRTSPAIDTGGKEKSPKLKIIPKRRHNKLRESPPSDGTLTDSQILPVTYEDIQHEEEILKLIRQGDDEKKRAQNCTETTHALNQPHPLSPLNPAPQLEPNTPTIPHSDKKKMRRTCLSNNHKDDISCTPVPPPLAVPIVTSTDQTCDRIKTRSMGVPKILLSSLNTQEKADYGSLIQELGGIYMESDHFRSECTHLIVGRSSRTEKYLAACASGKWILRKSYMETCRAEKRFVKEDDYEWSPACQPTGKGGPLDEAPRKWRTKLQNERKKGAFEGWKVLLCVEPSKQNGLQRLLEAGGAKVTPPTQLSVDNKSTTSSLTHAFLLTSSHLPSVTSLEELVKQDVLCLRPDYIAEYLQKEPECNPEQFLLPAALKLMKSKNEQ